jgi:hypothetical protein
MTGVKQIIDRVEALAARYPGWRGFRLLAEGEFQRLRGDLESARHAFERSIAESAPHPDHPNRQNTTWPAAVAGYVEVLLAEGRAKQARAYGENALRTCGELGIGVSAYAIARAVALADAKLGDHANAAARIEGMIAEQIALGVKGLPLGASYEARARIAISAGDEQALHAYAELTAREYRHATGSALGARYERLMTEARRERHRRSDATGELVTGASEPDARDRPTLHASLPEQLSGATSSVERANRALALLCAAQGADVGHLFLFGETELTVAASHRATQPPPGLLEYVTAYAHHAFGDYAQTVELDGSPEDQALQLAFVDEQGVSHQPLLLTCHRGGKMHCAGLVTFAPARHRTLSANTEPLLSVLAAYLLGTGDASPMIPRAVADAELR